VKEKTRFWEKTAIGEGRVKSKKRPATPGTSGEQSHQGKWCQATPGIRPPGENEKDANVSAERVERSIADRGTLDPISRQQKKKKGKRKEKRVRSKKGKAPGSKGKGASSGGIRSTKGKGRKQEGRGGFREGGKVGKESVSYRQTGLREEPERRKAKCV